MSPDFPGAEDQVLATGTLPATGCVRVSVLRPYRRGRCPGGGRKAPEAGKNFRVISPEQKKGTYFSEGSRDILGLNGRHHPLVQVAVRVGILRIGDEGKRVEVVDGDHHFL